MNDLYKLCAINSVNCCKDAPGKQEKLQECSDGLVFGQFGRTGQKPGIFLCPKSSHDTLHMFFLSFLLIHKFFHQTVDPLFFFLFPRGIHIYFKGLLKMMYLHCWNHGSFIIWFSIVWYYRQNLIFAIKALVGFEF